MKRYSVLYLLNEQYHHIGSHTQEDAKAILEKLSTDKRRIAVGVYDAKTELIAWAPAYQIIYDQAGIGGQGNRANQIITIAQALRRRDLNWQGDFRRPSFFA
jgi:uncharacterized membrane protein affecting hemolysin expression